ncbi:uncharacterized protein LOC121875695 isoform X2 [Homarus americanus]|uniref:uncharacterized protein LOC121875695 isoform X2 n=1 Tax=Homarus americanus TaxID=6706 RepID=UPI001C46E546|nr:uncharacterized protein LOC121875695 isoform X2 [Homarus americanus]
MTLVLPYSGHKRLWELLAMLTILGARVVWAEVTLVHEGALGGAAWGYSLLPSTFPLTWDEARAACEVVPGSMLARVEEWQAEAAVEEYLKTLQFTQPVWLANRQTLPEVLEDEQREMNHVGSVGGGRAGVMSGDLSMGGDVGVTLRCAVYRVSVGVVHELCSANTVSAALCVQRLSSQRPLSAECPPSAYRQWLLVTRQTETTKSQGLDETKVSMEGLQQCHHHHLGHTTCHPQRGWLHTICPPEPEPETSPPKHNKNYKKSHRNHHQLSHGQMRPSYKLSHFFWGVSDHVGQDDHQETTKEFHAGESFLHESKRMKRMATTSEAQTNSEENLGSHKAETALPSQMNEMRVAPMAKPENLNLDLIESIMQDFSGFTKSKVNKIKGTKHTQGNSKMTQNDPEIDGHRADTPHVLGEITHQNLHDKDAMENSGKTEDNKSEGNASPKIDGKLAETSGSHTSEKSKGQTSNENDSHRTQEQIQGKEERTKIEVGGEEETGPNILVGVGPIFVEEPEDLIIEAAEAEEPVDETMPGEVVVITKLENLKEGRETVTTKGSNTTTEKKPIIFPVLPEFTNPEGLESVSSNVINTGSSNVENADKTIKNTSLPKGGTPPVPSSNTLPIIFPRDDSQLQQNSDKTKAEDVAATNAAIVKTPQDNTTDLAEGGLVTAAGEQSGIGQLGITVVMQDMTVKPSINNISPQRVMNASDDKPEKDDMEAPKMDDMKAPEMGDMEEKSEMGDTEEKSEMGDTEEKSEFGDMEEKSEMGDMEKKSEMGDMEEKSEMGDMEEKSEMGDMEEKSEMGEMDDMEEKSEMGDMEEKSEKGEMEEKSEMGEMEEKSDMGDMEEEPEIDGIMGDMAGKREMDETAKVHNKDSASDMGEKTNTDDGITGPHTDKHVGNFMPEGTMKETSSSTGEQISNKKTPYTSDSEEDINSEEESKQSMRHTNNSSGQGTQGLLSQIFRGIFG